MPWPHQHWSRVASQRLRSHLPQLGIGLEFVLGTPKNRTLSRRIGSSVDPQELEFFSDSQKAIRRCPRHLSSDSRPSRRHSLLPTLPQEERHAFLPPFPTIATVFPLQISCHSDKNSLLFDHIRPAEPDQPVPPCRPFRPQNSACQNGSSGSWPEALRGPPMDPPHWRNARASHDSCLPGA